MNVAHAGNDGYRAPRVSAGRATSYGTTCGKMKPFRRGGAGVPLEHINGPCRRISREIDVTLTAIRDGRGGPRSIRWPAA
jgi:hypothetical protein